MTTAVLSKTKRRKLKKILNTLRYEPYVLTAEEALELILEVMVVEDEPIH